MKLRTYSGLLVDPFKLKSSDVRLIDIAQGLSQLCRFAGQTPQFYSVAQHSVKVAHILLAEGCPPIVALIGLLHDASEAYMVDVPTMIKAKLPKYQKAEAKLQKTILKALVPDGIFHGNISAAVGIIKKADLAALDVELKLLFRPDNASSIAIPEWAPLEARQRFLAMFEHLLRSL